MGRNKLFRVSEEVQDALATGKPVVALETTIYTHGFPYPESVALASHLESLVRVHGGIPATIGILHGVARVGMAANELIELVSTAGSDRTWKISRRDLSLIGGLGLRGHRLNGGTTIAGTMVLAHLAGIRVFATGGLGGVHRGGQDSMDISADLTELGRTPVAVISAGCKSFLDIRRTLEFLETQGVGVATFADGRPGLVDFPAFFARDSGVQSPQTIVNEADAAAVIYAQSQLSLQSGLLFANPVPEHSAMTKDEIDSIISQAVAEADAQGIAGSANTPFILRRIRELSQGSSVKANRALIEANIIRGTTVAVELEKLERQMAAAPVHRAPATTSRPVSRPSIVCREGETAAPPSTSAPAVDVLVAGSLASDVLCDYQPFPNAADPVSPAPHTSNPSIIQQSAGGVGRNVAVAAHLAGAKVGLASVVADDIAGSRLLGQMDRCGVGSHHIRRLPASAGARTAQYVAVNDAGKDLVVAMADMSILAHPALEDPAYWTALMAQSTPKWVAVDANWSPAILSTIMAAAQTHGARVAFEPVSTAKATRLFDPATAVVTTDRVVPNHVVSLSLPNSLELQALYHAARSASMFESQPWWAVIDGFGLSGATSQDRLTAVAGRDLVDEGIPQQCLQLLPYIPNLVAKLGRRGALVAQLLRRDDERLRRPEYTPYILSRVSVPDTEIGGIFMRRCPPSHEVPPDQIVSVNGIGDTMLGVIVAGLAMGRRLEDTIPIAQDAAILTLKSPDAVAPAVQSIQARLRTNNAVRGT